MVDRSVIEEVSGDNLLDDLLLDLPSEVLSGDIVRVLSGDDNGVNTERDGSTTILLVLDGNLSLGIGPQPVQLSGPASRSQSSVQLVRKDDRQRHVFFGLVGGISEHDTLITGTNRLKRTMVQSLSDIGGLLLNCDKDVASLVIESLVGTVVSDLFDGLSNDLLVIDLALGGNFTENHDHASFGSGLAGDLGEGVLLEACIELERRNEELSTIFLYLRPRHKNRSVELTMASETWSQILSGDQSK